MEADLRCWTLPDGGGNSKSLYSSHDGALPVTCREKYTCAYGVCEHAFAAVLLAGEAVLICYLT